MNVIKNLMVALVSLFVVSQTYADVKVIKKVPPEFPEEAVRKKVTEGVIKAKLTIDAQGNVSNVEVIDAQPAKAKVFGPAAIDALSKWKFEATGKQESSEIKLVFSEE